MRSLSSVCATLGLVTGFWAGFAGSFSLGLTAGLSAQTTGRPAAGRAKPADLVAALAGADDLARELARRQLALTESLPRQQLALLLGAARVETVVAAASLLRDRGLDTEKLQRLVRHEVAAVRLAVLPVATDTDLRSVFERDRRPAVRRAAFFELEDRGKLTDELLLDGLRSEHQSIAESASRLVVFERSPFPIAIAERLLAAPTARRRLLTFLAERPRARSGPWLQKVLGQSALDAFERLLAIQALPPEWLDRQLGREVLAAAVAERADLSTRAVAVAARFPSELADQLVPDVFGRLGQGSPNADLLACLVCVSGVGERRIFELAVRASGPVRRAVSHWLSARESALVPQYIAALLDGDGEFPPELVGLVGPALRPGGVEKPRRIAKVIAILEVGGKPAVAAFTALLEAAVFRPAMAEYAEAGVMDDKARRLYRLFKLPPSQLPLALFQRVFAGDDLDAHIYAAHALGRSPLAKPLEPRLLEFALASRFSLLKAAASRAIVRSGSEAAGRQVFRAQAGNQQVIDWLIHKPKPWSHDLLLQARDGMLVEKRQHAAHYHRVLIALANLGDRGANEELIAELPFLRLAELQQAQILMGRYFQAADLERLAKQHLVPRKPAEPGKPGEPGKPSEELELSFGDQRRAELLDWFLGRKELDLEPLLWRLFRSDGDYEVRLVALRGLLARDSEALYRELASLIETPHGDDQEELAFEVVGSMSHPLSDRSLTLLAQIVLTAPLAEPGREVRLSLEQGHGSVRGAYPLLRPIANLLRRDDKVRPGRVFRAVADKIGGRRFALNRQRLGLFLTGLSLHAGLLQDLGPVLAELIVSAPDTAPDFVGPAQMVLGDQAEQTGAYSDAAKHYAAATRDFSRGVVPYHIQRSFLRDVDPRAGRHPYAALAAQAPICRARVMFAGGQIGAGLEELARARDLAEGDHHTIAEISELRSTHRR